MGQPDLVYRFLDAATHHSAWQSRLGAAFSLTAIPELEQKFAQRMQCGC